MHACRVIRHCPNTLRRVLGAVPSRRPTLCDEQTPASLVLMANIPSRGSKLTQQLLWELLRVDLAEVLLDVAGGVD